jgi:hypothetical protein
MRSFTIGLVLIVSLSAAQAADAPVLEIPGDYSTSVDFKPGSYGKIVLKGRCSDPDEDGPKESKPLLNGDSKAVTVLAVRTRSDQTLYESLRAKTPGGALEFSADQNGCSHFGTNFTLLVDEKIDLKDKTAIWKRARAWFEWIPLSKHGKSEAESLAKWVKRAKPPNCESTPKRIHCSSYEDPNNYELEITPSEKNPKLNGVAFRYWYVL